MWRFRACGVRLATTFRLCFRNINLLTTTAGFSTVRFRSEMQLGLISILLLLAACGGGQGSGSDVLNEAGKSSDSAPIADRKDLILAKSFFPEVAVPNDANVKGNVVACLRMARCGGACVVATRQPGAQLR